MLALFALLIASAPDERLVITIDRDNIEITESCTIKIAASPIIDADGNGVIHIATDGVEVDFANEHVHGSPPDKLPNEFAGTGIRITAKNVTLANAKISGFKVGIHATNADSLTIHHCDVSNNFHQRLKSTPQKEDESDWLWPHANDNDEWITNYGAGICVKDSDKVELHNIRARTTQNGIILDRVNDSKVYDCDCSFLSGWGLALWRSNRNVISRNAFDFCIRGYSHGVYNRGQDSAGILMFEQCCNNIIAENSATHCGDGFFGFAGKEALGEVNPREDVSWYLQRGCTLNFFFGNEFSYSAAHGLELTFSFKGFIRDNAFRGNAICGIWAGYSQMFTIRKNVFEKNGEAGYGSERGGVNIDSGALNEVLANVLRENTCGVRFWAKPNEALAATPWYRANVIGPSGGTIEKNSFDRDRIGIELRDSIAVMILDNSMQGVATTLDSAPTVTLVEPPPVGLRCVGFWDTVVPPTHVVRGQSKPVGARAHLAGRENIIMTEWGPWDHEGPRPTTQPADTKDD